MLSLNPKTGFYFCHICLNGVPEQTAPLFTIRNKTSILFPTRNCRIPGTDVFDFKNIFDEKIDKKILLKLLLVFAKH
jgi:hypothetical protein